MAYGSSGLAFIYPRPASGLTDERLTVSSTAGGVQFSSLSAWAVNGLTRMVVLDVQTADVMVTFDGSAPTTTNGHRLYAGQNYTWSYETAAAAKFIRATGTDGVIHASPFTY